MRVQGDIRNRGLVTAPGPGGGAHIKFFGDDPGDPGQFVTDNALVDEFFAGNDFAGSFLAVGSRAIDIYSRTGFETIPDNGTITSSLSVPPSAGTISQLRVDLVIDHVFASDLDVTLRHAPSGRTISLFTDVGSSANGFNIRLNDFAGLSITSATAATDRPVFGEYRPEAPALLSTFRGLDATGEWQLIVTDDTAGNFGTLVSWTLNVAY